ncbi:hypothetical protein C5F59_036560 [Streptomyces sp. QL37]|uniref:hypothetical protein n=1 Tax=Streptomyces sp. QL37 TaxID=2093747 RepID=UPI0021CB2904|nr:hypothetical protein [Streptomyces sp. QL37]
MIGTHAFEQAREHRELRRGCYTELHKDARQFSTALSRHLYVMRDRTAEAEDIRALEETKDTYRDRWSEALMIASDTVVPSAHDVNEALNLVYGQVKRLEQGRSRPGETLRSAAEAQHSLWALIGAMREAMRGDLGVTDDPHPGIRSGELPEAVRRDFGVAEET